jgi:hypothetical protein
MPFQKGQSGNPGGRPKVVAEVRDLARKYTPDAIETLVEIMRKGDAADAAKVAAANSLLDRGWGKPSGSEVNLTLNGNRQVHVHLERETLELLEEARALLAKPVEVERSQ